MKGLLNFYFFKGIEEIAIIFGWHIQNSLEKFDHVVQCKIMMHFADIKIS